MKRIVRNELLTALQPYEGQTVYLHVEVTPGAFVRNVEVAVTHVHVAGDDPYRVALRFTEDGWVRVEGLTHMAVDEQGRLLLAGHDEKGRLLSALELSLKRFPV